MSNEPIPDPLSLFEAETVPPPRPNEFDAVIDAASSGGRPSPALTSTGPEGTAASSTIAEGSQRALIAMLLRPVIVRWVVPSLVAFGVGAGITVWGLRSLERQPTSVAQKPLPNPRTSQPRELTRVPDQPPALPSRVLSLPNLVLPPLQTGRPVPLLNDVAVDTNRSLAGLDPNAARPSVAPQRSAPLVAATAGGAATTAREANGSPAGSRLPSGTPGTTSAALLPSTPSPLPHLVVPPIPETILSAALAVGGLPEAPSLGTRSLMAAEAASVRGTLDQYVEAYAQMNVRATAEVWPSVDRSALARAFDTLKSQGLAFDTCKIDVADTTAVARCSGSVQFVRKVGSTAPRIEQQEWLFKMRKLGTEWKIDGVTASRHPAAAAVHLREDD